MHVRVRFFGKPDTIVVVESKLTKVEQFRKIIREKFDVLPKLQRLFYGGKLLEDGYTFHDYNIKLNDVIQLMVKQQAEAPAVVQKESTASQKVENNDKNDIKENDYKDAESALYMVGDLIDMKDREQGAWFEGKIVRIVQDNNCLSPKITGTKQKPTEESDSENTPPSDSTNSKTNTKPLKRGIAEYFSKTPRKKQADKNSTSVIEKPDEKPDINLLFKIVLDADEENTYHYCKLKEIRPRARKVIPIENLKVGQKVMINHNSENILEKGYWYDFKVVEIKKLRTSYEVLGTLYLGPDAIPQNDTKVRVNDKIYAIEEVVPLADRTEEYKKLMITPPDKRCLPLNCLTCRDDEDAPCKDCGCFLCSGKDFPEKIVLCDECNNGYHMNCLVPPLESLPEEDWYCPSCKRDPNIVVAPGAARQRKKTPASQTKRDWGRGMACVGKTKTCSMPPNHFGPIPGIEVGMCWRFRIQLSESGVHRPPVSGIHGRDVEGAYSIVLSGGYEDDVDHGNEFTYTGSGGRDLSGNKRTAEQSCDQTLTRENKALARNCAVKKITEEGGDAGDEWRSGRPVRVVRSYKMIKHFPKYAPKEGIRYDGIYKVVKYYPEVGLSGFRVWKYLLRRDDPSPAPWEPGAKQYEIVYPDGYLEAEAEKQALKAKNGKGPKNSKGPKGAKGKKRALYESNSSPDKDDIPLSKRRKSEAAKKADIRNSVQTSKSGHTKEIVNLNNTEKEAIKADTANSKLWNECLLVAETRGKKEFVEYVAQMFLCIICQEVAVSPTTTPCLHNFCLACLKLAFKSTGTKTCPCCRQDISKTEMQPNEQLKTALQTVMPGYDAGKK